MKAEELAKRLKLTGHDEGGLFREANDDNPWLDKRPSGGAIYYYLGPADYSEFHLMSDSDEYWCHLEGSALEIWELDKGKNVRKRVLGKGEGEEPILLVKSGIIFGVRHKKGEKEGTLSACITAPRFKDEIIFNKEEIISKYPEAKGFYD